MEYSSKLMALHLPGEFSLDSLSDYGRCSYPLENPVDSVLDVWLPVVMVIKRVHTLVLRVLPIWFGTLDAIA